MILGTAAYMSPEQARGQAVDKRADIWAFGCVLFEMLTGRPPFEGETSIELLGSVMHKEPAWGLLPAGILGADSPFTSSLFGQRSAKPNARRRRCPNRA